MEQPSQSNATIRDFAAHAFAYIRTDERAAWLRRWRSEARRVGLPRLKVLLNREIMRFRMIHGRLRATCEVGDGTAGYVHRYHG
jgi:hypothetical protein